MKINPLKLEKILTSCHILIIKKKKINFLILIKKLPDLQHYLHSIYQLLF